MVVICIAGVLMALLLPALSTAKEKSRRSVCNGNLRQVIAALTLYANDDEHGFLPPANDNRGDAYHSILLSSFTFTNLVGSYLGESNVLYCPNLVYETGKMGGYDPDAGYTIGYSYLATIALPAIPQGPNQVQSWSGPLKATENGEVIADANYWSKPASSVMAMNSSRVITVAPHTSGGSSVLASQAGVPASAGVGSATARVAAGATSAAVGAMGGNVGSLDNSVIWLPIRAMKQYPASTDGALGNW